MRLEAGPSRNPGRPQGEDNGREAQAPPTSPDGAAPLWAPVHPSLAAVGHGPPDTLGLPSPPPHPVGSSEAGPKNQSRDQRAQTAASSGSAPGGGSRGGEESPRTGAEKGVAGGARAVLAPRGLGLRASAERASRGGAHPRPDQSAAAAAGGWAGPMRESLGGVSDRKGGPGVAVWLANRDEKSGSWRVGLGAGKA